MRADLIALGFNMKTIDQFAAEPLDASSEGLHINPLKFLDCIINLWLSIWIIQRMNPCPSGFILDLWSNNTLALSWMSLTAATHDPHVQLLACLASMFLVIASQHLTRVQPCHIPGQLNFEAGYLSRSDNGHVPSWERVTAQCSQLWTHLVCFLLCHLLSLLARLLSFGLTEGTYVQLAT
jgi:hypothetical protein